MKYPRIKILEWEEFIKVLNIVKSAQSARDNKKYSNIKVVEKYVVGKREGGGEFKIDIEQLYLAHRKESLISTTVLRNYIKTRAQSPSLAILAEMGIIQI